MKAKYSSIFVCAALSIAACAGETEPRPDRGRAPLGKADLAGSCAPSDCGGPSSSSACWCDDQCDDYGDCCENKAATCDLQSCGGFGGFACPEGFVCVDDPGDDCDPAAGGADCAGICEPAPGPAGNSCEGHCGGKSADGSCWCDEQCAEYGDCCGDKAAVCEAECPPVCEIACPYGNVLDENGCEICECNPAPSCGGFGNVPCPDGFVCLDDPGDDCDPDTGADCPGLCAPEPASECASEAYCDAVCAGTEPPPLPDGCPLPLCGCPAPAPDSCETHCGGQSADASCWCDDQCAAYGDCCADYLTHCE